MPAPVRSNWPYPGITSPSEQPGTTPGKAATADRSPKGPREQVTRTIGSGCARNVALPNLKVSVGPSRGAVRTERGPDG